jgi:hypothetical protein
MSSRNLEIHNSYSLISNILPSLFRLLGRGDETEGGYTRLAIVFGLEGVASTNALGVADFATVLNGVTNFGLAVALPCLGVKPNGF